MLEVLLHSWTEMLMDLVFKDVTVHPHISFFVRTTHQSEVVQVMFD